MPPLPAGSLLAGGAAGAAAAACCACRRWLRAHRQPLPPDASVEFITDVEGNWEYFLNLVKLSKVLHWEGADQGAWGPGTLALRPGGYLVFGGDSQDKGPGDIRFVKTLLHMKRKYPSRVIIILGNRDINKLRFHAELAPGETPSASIAYWDPKAKPYREYIEEKGLVEGKIAILRWILECTMGGATTFETRRHELQLLQPSLSGGATDEDVLRSFQDSVDPQGSDPWMLEFLRAGQLVAVLGDTLFVHGGLHDAGIRVVPGADGGVRRTGGGVDEWARALNGWKDAQLRDFARRPRWRDAAGGRVPAAENGLFDAARAAGRKRGGEWLMDYGLHVGAGGATVVVRSWHDNGNAAAPPAGVAAFAAASGVRRVFTGHQPHGQAPSVVRDHKSGLITMLCDTSYSDLGAPKDQNPANNRGGVACCVSITQDAVRVDGELSDGTRHGYTLHTAPERDTFPDALVGRQLDTGHWVKSVRADGRVRCVKGEGFKILVDRICPKEAFERLLFEHSLQPGQGPADDFPLSSSHRDDDEHCPRH